MREAERFSEFSDRLLPLAGAVFPTVTGPLQRESVLRERVADGALWDALTRRPLGGLLREGLHTDIARGIALTDGLIGTFSWSDDPSLRQNRCFLYHVIGGGTGDWDVPVGGMGRVSAALEQAARRAGAELRVNATVTAVDPGGEVTLASGETITGRLVLSGVGPAVLERLIAGSADVPDAQGVPEGAQLKINMLLSRLPRLRDTTVAPEAAFAGTFHVNETMTQLDDAHAAATGGGIPQPLPAEIYCHSLTDPSILGPELQESGAQTLTLFGLQLPHRLGADRTSADYRAAVLDAARRSLDAVLAEPIDDCLFLAPDGSACIEELTTADL